MTLPVRLFMGGRFNPKTRLHKLVVQGRVSRSLTFGEREAVVVFEGAFDWHREAQSGCSYSTSLTSLKPVVWYLLVGRPQFRLALRQ